MAEPLEGTFSAEHSARLLRNYRYVVERTMRALGGWIALTPELSAKLLMGRHVWDLAQQCDAFGQRLPELRSRAHVSRASTPLARKQKATARVAFALAAESLNASAGCRRAATRSSHRRA